MGNIRAQLCKTEIKVLCVYSLLFFVSWNFKANQVRIIITLKFFLNLKKKFHIWIFSAYSMVQQVKYLPAMQETQETGVWSLGGEDLLEEEMAPHSSILWRRRWQPIPLFSPGEFHGQTMESQRIGHDWATNTHTSILAWKTLLDKETWWAIVYGVAELDTAEHARIYLNFTRQEPWGKWYQ